MAEVKEGTWRARRHLFSLVLLAVALPASAAPLPDPLTLDHVLSLVEEGHPEMEIARADLERAKWERAGAAARQDLTLSFEGRARWVQPADVVPDQDREDHKASLLARKNLWDFGRTSALERAAEERVRASGFRYEDRRSQRRIAIMERYFDVLLADKEFSRQDENMALAYVSLDRLRQRHELHQISDITLLAAESEYQTARRARYAAEARQRLTRAALADLLNRPGELSANLAAPELPQLTRSLPEVEPLIEAAVANNAGLQVLRAEVESARERMAAARAENRPRLTGELEASAYSRDLASNDQWRAGVTLEVPLYTGGAVTALVSQRQADVYEAQARLRQAEMEVRQAVLDLYLQLQSLKVQREEADARYAFRELYLDRSRTIYEQEVTADLGDAMLLLTEAELAAMRTDFETALAWERLDALTGGPVPENKE